MKKLLFTTCTILTLGVSHNAMAQEQDYSYSPYIGAYGGYGWTDSDAPGAKVEPNGGDYGLYAGFEADALLDSTINRTGMALKGAVEGYYGWSDAKDTTGGVSLEKKNEWGVRFRPGIEFLHNDYIIDTTPYAIVGYKQSEYDTVVGGVSGDETFHGFELGAGTEILAYDNVGVRVDYTHVFYGTEGGFNPDEDNIRLGASYHF